MKQQKMKPSLIEKLVAEKGRPTTATKVLETPKKDSRPQTAQPVQKLSTAKKGKEKKAEEKKTPIKTVPRQNTDLFPDSPMKKEHVAAIRELRQEGATEQEIEEYKRNEIIVKSIKKIKENAQQMQERRTSPQRYRNAESKIHTINPYTKFLSSKGKLSPSKTLTQSPSKESPLKDSPRKSSPALSPSKSPSGLRTASPFKSPKKYSERNAGELVPNTKERLPLLGSTVKRLHEADDKIEAQERLLEEMRRTIEEQRARRTAKFAYRKQAHEESDRAIKRVINSQTKLFKPEAHLQRPTFHADQFAIPEYKPIELPSFEPITPVKANSQKQSNEQMFKPTQPVEKNKYFNKKLMERLELLNQETRQTEEELEVYRASIDREVFYDQLRHWDYGGIKPYDQPTSQKALLPRKEIQNKYGLAQYEKGGAMYYSVGPHAYYVEFKPVNYALFDKDPMAFYEKMMTQEMLVVKAKGVKKSKKYGEETVEFSEFTQKRHIGARVDAFKAAVEEANFKKAERAAANHRLTEESKSAIGVYMRNSTMKRQESLVKPTEKMSMAETVRHWIFYKYLMKLLGEIEGFRKQDLAELNAQANPPALVRHLFDAVAAILAYEGPINSLVHPKNVRMFSQINIVEVRRENLLPFRNFAAKHSVAEVMSRSMAAASLFLWCQYVDEAYKMTNKEEFKFVQQSKIIFSAQAPGTAIRMRFAGGSFFDKINAERNANQEGSDSKIRDISLSPEPGGNGYPFAPTFDPITEVQSQAHSEEGPPVVRESIRESQPNLSFMIHDEELRKTGQSKL